MFVDVAREAHREHMPKLAFGSRLETLVVGVCVAIGHLDGNPFSAAKLAAYLDCPRTSVIRRLDALAKMQIIVRTGTRYYLNEPRFNSDSAIKSYDKVRRIVLKAATQLSAMDTVES
jgi:DNA-binding IclR family transcriptional regulator